MVIEKDGPALLSRRDVARLLGVTERSVMRLADEGKLPPPISISRKVVRWCPRQLARHLELLQPGGSPAA